jgi:hypothetical protein
MQVERRRVGTATPRHYEMGGQHHARATLPLVGIQNAGCVGLDNKENVDATGIRSLDRPSSPRRVAINNFAIPAATFHL